MKESTRKNEPRLQSYNNTGYDGNFDEIQHQHSISKPKEGIHQLRRQELDRDIAQEGTYGINWKKVALVTITLIVLLVIACAAVGIFFALKNSSDREGGAEVEAPGKSSSTSSVSTTSTSSPSSISTKSTTHSPSLTTFISSSVSHSKPTSEVVDTTSILTSSSVSTSRSPSLTSISASTSTSTLSTTPDLSECHDGEFRCLIFQECIPDVKHCDEIKDCADSSDEWYDCGITQQPWLPLDLEIRLVYNEEESTTKGRVEVRRRGLNEEFGTVCGEGWTLEDATVVCRMLNQGFVGSAFAYSSAVFGEGKGDIVLSNVGCHGNESNLGDCKSRGFGFGLVHCSHAQDAGVTCDGSQIMTSPLPPIQGPASDVRLIRGSSCLSGLLQIYHKDEWRFVCSNNFGIPEATVVCRMLGFNAGVGALDNFGYFGYGDGLYWLDNVDCRGNESHLFNCTSNPFGENDCSVYQAVGLFCSGKKEIECEEQEPCVSNIDCSFESDDCCYGFIPSEMEGEGTTPWVRYNAGQITLKDHTAQNESGYIAYYHNVYGTKNDFAYLDLPEILLNDHKHKIEFFYLIKFYDAEALSLNLVKSGNKTADVWKPTHVTKELEGIWTYGCMDIQQQQQVENATLRFIGRRGPLSTRIIALDDVKLSEGNCLDISNKRCDFDDIGTCSARIICSDCDQGYRWRLVSIDSDIEPDDDRSNEMENFMIVDASYGRPQNVARLEFYITDNAFGKQGLRFKYRYSGNMEIGGESTSLKVVLHSNNPIVLWQRKFSETRNVWLISCIDIHDINDVTTLTFEAERGSDVFGDVALDDVELVDYCPLPGSCDFEEELCGYEVKAFDADLYNWGISSKDVDNTVDDTPMPGKFFHLLDNSAPFGAWAKLVSPLFNISTIPYKLTFQLFKSGPGEFQVYVVSNNVRYNFNVDFLPIAVQTAGTENVCLNFGNLDLENVQLVFEAVKRDDWFVQPSTIDDKMSVDNIEITTGECKVPSKCTFEADHWSCNYKSFSVERDDYVNCVSGYKWRRRVKSIPDDIIGDFTFGNESGHYLAVSTAHGDDSSIATVIFHFKNTRSTQDMHVVLYTRISTHIKIGMSMQLAVREVDLDLIENFSFTDVWRPSCVNVFIEANETITVNVTARQIDAAIDDVSLEPGRCPPQSESCMFEDRLMCGYMVGKGGKFLNLLNDSFIRLSKTGATFISPSFEVNSSLCLSIEVRRSVRNNNENVSYLEMSLVRDEDLSSLPLRHNQFPLINWEWKRLYYLQAFLPSARYWLSFTAYLDDEESIDINSVTVGGSYCAAPECPDDDDIICEEGGLTFCMPLADACKNRNLCAAATLAICSTADCDFEDNYPCRWLVEHADVINNTLVLGEERFTFAETPVMDVKTESCMTFTLIKDFNDNTLRIVKNSSGFLEEIENFHQLKSQGHIQELTVNLPVGRYSIMFEARHYKDVAARLYLDDVTMFKEKCRHSQCSGSVCSFVDDYSNLKSVCFQYDILCDKYVDCPLDRDEDGCEYSFNCDFDTTICGYDISEGLDHVHTPYKIPATDMIVPTIAGQRNEFVLLYNSANAVMAEFTSGPLILSHKICDIEFHVFCHIDPLVNSSVASASMKIVARDLYRNPSHYEMSLNITSKWTKLTIPVKDLLLEHNDLDGRFVPTFHLSGSGVIIAIDNMNIVYCHEENTTQPITTMRPSQTGSELPEGFPNLASIVSEINVQIFDQVVMSCLINKDAEYKYVLHWYKDDVQISRATDIINQEFIELFGHDDMNIPKYDVTFSATDVAGFTKNYMLTIERMVHTDAGVYTCKLVAQGHTRDVSIVVTVLADAFAVTDDMCYKNTISICHDLGFDKIMTPGPVGILDVAEASMQLGKDLGNIEFHDGMSEQCKMSMYALQCGIYSPKCENGRTRPVCREHCEETIKACLQEEINNKSLASFKNSCKFLPYSLDDPSCIPVFKGCYLTYTAKEGRFMTENYPHPYPQNSKCMWNISVDPYHFVQVDIDYFDIGSGKDNADECGLKIYDVSNEQDIIFLPCGNALLPFSSIGNNMTLIFNSDETSTGNGFSIRYRQVPVNACLSFSAEKNVTVRSNDWSEIRCKSFKIYLNEKRDTLVLKIMYLTNGCLQISNDNGIKDRVCDATSIKEYKTFGYVDINVDSKEVIYTVFAYKVAHERKVSNVALDNKGAVEVTSEGDIGSLCGVVDQTTGDILCRSLGLGWPATGTFVSRTVNDLPSLVSEIKCNGKETDITKCQFVFEALGNRYCILLKYFGIIPVITCRQTSISCDFNLSTCGYEFGNEIQLSKIYGLHLQHSTRNKGMITSPEFSYSEGVNIHFHYSMRRAVGEKLIIKLHNIQKDEVTDLWKHENYAVYGNFKGCASLPAPSQTVDSFQIIIEYISGENLWNNNTAEYTGIQNLNLSFVPCAEDDIGVHCDFENLDACANFVYMKDFACRNEDNGGQETFVTSGGTFSRGEDWIQSDHTTGVPSGHFLLVNEGSSTPFVNVSETLTGLGYLRFYYAITKGKQDLSNATLSISAGEERIYTAGELGKGWLEACIRISDYISQQLVLSFGKNNGKEDDGTEHKFATLAIDDISVTPTPCGYNINCNFEDDCTLYYHSLKDDNISFPWIKDFVSLTYSLHNGYYMKASFDLSSAEGDIAVLESDNLSQEDDIQCLQFQYLINGTNNPGSLHVRLPMDNESRVVFVANGNLGDDWFTFHVPVDHKVNLVQFIATKGNGIGDILLDNVVFSPEACYNTLNAVGTCSFDNPSLCGVKTDIMTSWKRGNPTILHDVIKYDADFRNDGHFYFIKRNDISSDSVRNELKFTVSGTNNSALQFSLFSMSGRPLFLYSEVNGNKQTIPVKVEENWILTDCFDIPDEFSGDIVIGIEAGNTGFELLAIDNVRLLDKKECTGPSLSCDFKTDGKCSYIAPTEHVIFEGGLALIGPGVVRAPTVLLSTTSCFRFVYSVTSVDSFDEQAQLYLYQNGQEVWSVNGRLKPKASSVQIDLKAGVITVYFESKGKGLYKLLATTVREGPCHEIPLLDCNGFLCGDRCLSNDRKCDRYIDCLDAADESENLCGFKYSTDFTQESDLESTGFRTSDSSYVLWTLENNLDLSVDERTKIFNTPFLVARFPNPIARPAILESFEYHLENDSCLQINYIGDVAYGEIHITYDTESEKDAEVSFKIKPSLDIRHISVPVLKGNVRVILYIYMFEIQPFLSNILETSLFAVEHITMHEGKSCDELSVECLAVNDTLCDDRRSCYSIEENCDSNADCYDESDEINYCDNGIVCDFEHPTMCGYSNISPRRIYLDYRRGGGFYQSLWERIKSSVISRPTMDHTIQKTGEGHFLISRNFEGLPDVSRYVDVESIESPFQTFENDGCVTFWYYLNTSDHQPKTTSAQIFVYIQYEDEEEKALVWFDHINRPFTSWIKGGAQVHGRKSVKLIVTAKTSIPYDSFPGIVSLDDVSYAPGKCDVDKIECDALMFQCTKDKICIPESFVCDGEIDCQDGTDEGFCGRPNGIYKLLDGDQSYGKLAYFYNGAWRPVCYQHPDDVTTDEQILNDANIAFYVCRKLGFTGNSDMFEYKLWGRYSPINVQLSCTESNNCKANITSESCDRYAYVMCSNEVCFDNEVVCPGTTSTCVPRSYICDGQQDCPKNSDEEQCYCYEDENQCKHTKDECKEDTTCETCKERGMFECFNHECINLSLRCDGRQDCSDASDEFKCVQIDDNSEVSMFMNTTLTREIFCVDDVTFERANLLCQEAGQGDVTEIKRSLESIRNGLNPVTLEIMSTCFPLRLKCHMPECGTTAIQDNIIQPFVINGRDTTIEEWPWYGFLQINGTFLCGASLIDPQWAITASHCFRRYTVYVVYTVSFGVNTRGSEDKLLQEIEVEEVIGNDYVSSPWLINDITLLRLKYPAKINNFTRPVCLPTPSSLLTIRTQGSRAECFVIGQGTTDKAFADPTSANVFPDVLQKKHVLILSKEFCKESWTSISIYKDSFPENVVCVGTEAPSSPICFGDSGGPLVCKANSGRWELFGIVSFGYGACYHDLIPSVLTSVADYREWIKDVTGLKLGELR